MVQLVPVNLMIGFNVTTESALPKSGNVMVRKTAWTDPMKTTVRNTNLPGESPIISTHQFLEDQTIPILMELSLMSGRLLSFIATIQRNFNANRQIFACPSLGFVMVE